jgi:hypothetical protein
VTSRVLGSRQALPNRALAANQLPANRREVYQERLERAQDIRGEWWDNRQEFWDDVFEPGWRLEYPHLAHAYHDWNHPYGHPVWAAAAWGAAAGWLGYGGYEDSWSEPYDYDYGSGGSVYYGDDSVYVGGQAAATPVQYAEQAMTIAESGAQQLAALDAQPPAAPVEWLTLGVYAITTVEGGEPTRFVQLAVTKDGLISGTYYNTLTNGALSVQGAVDRSTQRAAWYPEGHPTTVMEAGIHNLTQDQSSALLHFGTGEQQEVLLVRLPDKQQPTR